MSHLQDEANEDVTGPEAGEAAAEAQAADEADEYRFLVPWMRAFMEQHDAGEAAGIPPARFYPYGNDERVGHWLDRAYHAHQSLLRAALAPLGLTPAQGALLLEVSQMDHAWTHDHLARRLRVGRSVVTRMLQRLESSGHIRLQRHPADRRQRHVLLTEAGESLVVRLEEELERTDVELMARLRPGARRWFTLMLPRLEDAARHAAWERRACILEPDYSDVMMNSG